MSRIRKGLNEGALPMPFPEAEKENTSVFASSELSVEEKFADAFIKLGGKYVFCDNEQELFNNINILYENRGWKQLLCSDQRLLRLFHNNKLDFIHEADPELETAEACITDCEMLVARTGSVLISSRQYMGRVASVYYPVHIIVAYANQVAPDIEDSFNALKRKYGEELPSMVNLNTGPSRTADIEKTLVVGVHGPAEVFCFYVNVML